jgi:putative transcriptional regulator
LERRVQLEALAIAFPTTIAGLMLLGLREWRAKRDLNQGELAKLASVSRQTINSIETGKYEPSLTLALKLAKVFDCRVEDLFSLDRD